MIDPFGAFLRARAPEVGYEVVALAAAIREQGFAESYRTVARFVRRMKRRKEVGEFRRHHLVSTASAVAARSLPRGADRRGAANRKLNPVNVNGER